RAVTETYGKLNVLINNAGILRFALLEKMPLEAYLEVIRVNQVGCFLGMQAVVPAMRAAGGGSIVNTSSDKALGGRTGATAYVASKFAVRGMTKNAALELGRYNIRVNSVHPGGIDTEMTRFPGVDLSNRNASFANLPIPRIGQPEDVAEL